MKRILIVEDNELNRDVLSRRLTADAAIGTIPIIALDFLGLLEKMETLLQVPS